MEKNNWREDLQEIIEEEETDMERPMIPRYAKGYAKLVLENFISSVIEKERKKLVSDINDALKESIENNESVSKVIEKIDIKVFDIDESSTIRIDMINMVDKEIEKAEKRGRRDMENNYKLVLSDITRYIKSVESRMQKDLTLKDNK